MATFTNQATLSYNGEVLASNTVTGTIESEVTLTKTAVGETYEAGGTVTYVVSIINEGERTLRNLRLTDDLGGYEFEGDTVYPLRYVEGSVRLFVNGELQSAPDVDAGPPLQFSDLTVPGESSVLLIYETEVTEFAPLAAGSEITNTVTLCGRRLCQTLTAEETVRVESGALLNIAKALSPNPVRGCGGRITYTFTIRNSGNEPAAGSVILRDDFDPTLSELAVTYNDAPWGAGSYTYNPNTGRFATVPGAITVPAASFAQDPASGEWRVEPGEVVLKVSGTI